jgi:hypothetical protein
MADSMPDARAWISENGSHMAMYDDQIAYFRKLLTFLKSAWEPAESPVFRARLASERSWTSPDCVGKSARKTFFIASDIS